MAYLSLLQIMNIVFSFCLCPAVAFRLPNSTLYFSAGNRTTWTNNNQFLPQATKFEDGSFAFILFKTATSIPSTVGRIGYGFGFGFYCNWPFAGFCDLSVLFVDMLNGKVNTSRSPQVVWSANWNRPVRENATLKFSQGGNLYLIDENGTEIWSNYTSGMSIVGMSIEDNGNLLLLGESIAVWDSFNYPTDTLWIGQGISEYQQLTSRITSVNARKGLFSLSLRSPALVAFLVSDEPAQYLTVAPPMLDVPPSAIGRDTPHLKFVQLTTGGIGFYYQTKDGKLNEVTVVVSITAAIQFLRLDIDGGLKIFWWKPGNTWRMVHVWPDECWIPLKCGRYGVWKNGKCSCPVGPNGIDYFILRDYQYPNHGCREINYPVPFQGTISPEYEMIHFGILSYFINFVPKTFIPQLNNEESCKQACQQKTSCKAAFFVSMNVTSKGSCYLYSEILSLMGNPHEEGDYLSAYIKVASSKFVSSDQENAIHTSRYLTPLLAICASLLSMTVLVAICFLRRPKINFACKQQKDLKSLVSGTLISFSYKFNNNGNSSNFKSVLHYFGFP